MVVPCGQGGKDQFLTQSAAHQEIMKRGWVQTGYTYLCSVCNTWHISSHPKTRNTDQSELHRVLRQAARDAKATLIKKVSLATRVLQYQHKGKLYIYLYNKNSKKIRIREVRTVE